MTAWSSAPLPSAWTLSSLTSYALGGRPTGVGTSPPVAAPVSDPQWPAVSTQSGAIRVPLHPNEPPMAMFAT